MTKFFTFHTFYKLIKKLKNILDLDFHHCTSDQVNDRKKNISLSEQESLNPRGKLFGG